MTYEGLVADRRGTVERILDHIGVDPPPDWKPASPHQRQADDINADWGRQYRNLRGQVCSDASMQDLTQLR